MNRLEILAVTESDTKGCEAINKAVHEKLGRHWHRWYKKNPIYPEIGSRETQIKDGGYGCCDCDKVTAQRSGLSNPDYTHDIKAAWAIKEWLEEHNSVSKFMHTVAFQIPVVMQYPCWMSALERCQAFLVMDL